MPPKIALLLTVAFILWLLARDLKARQNVSPALWIPLLWLLILGSRPVSLWFGVQVAGGSELDGSPLDRLVFLCLLLAGVFVLVKRRVRFGGIVAGNKWLFIFFLYLGISVLWSDYPFVAFKRWIKDVGNIVMILVVLSEGEPVEAVKTVFLRCAYVLVPASVLCIKYFPDFGRGYDPYGNVSYGGVTMNKNMLGATLLIYSIVLLWEMLELHDDQSKARKKFEMSSCLLLLGMVAWLFLMAQSQTSLICTLLGAGILLAMRLPSIRSQASRIELYVLALALLLVFLNSVFDITGSFVHALGRNITLSGRTEIWQRALSVPINPLIGTGYYSFWLDPKRVDIVNADYWFRLNEAHSGYIETYLNEGLIGVFLLAALLISASRQIKRDLLNGEGAFNTVRLAFLAIAVAYNFTEAAFNRMGFIWFAFLLSIVSCPHSKDFVVNDPSEEAQERDDKSELETVAHYPPAGAFTA
jgi:exopolysaccharide production protein ExoQ